jgi:hypothetical protein
MTKQNTGSATTASGGSHQNPVTTRRSSQDTQDTREDEKRDPVAYWYAEALSRR